MFIRENPWLDVYGQPRSALMPFVALSELGRSGGQGRNRTADAGLFRAALYQLSYLARECKKRRSIGTGANACQLEDKVISISPDGRVFVGLVTKSR